MDRLADEVKLEFPLIIMFADNVLICSDSRGQVEESLKRWRLWREEEWKSVGARQNTCVTVLGL